MSGNVYKQEDQNQFGKRIPFKEESRYHSSGCKLSGNISRLLKIRKYQKPIRYELCNEVDRVAQSIEHEESSVELLQQKDYA